MLTEQNLTEHNITENHLPCDCREPSNRWPEIAENLQKSEQYSNFCTIAEFSWFWQLIPRFLRLIVWFPTQNVNQSNLTNTWKLIIQIKFGLKSNKHQISFEPSKYFFKNPKIPRTSRTLPWWFPAKRTTFLWTLSSDTNCRSRRLPYGSLKCSWNSSQGCGIPL